MMLAEATMLNKQYNYKSPEIYDAKQRLITVVTTIANGWPCPGGRMPADARAGKISI